MYTRTVLSNGLRILTCPMPHVRSATIGFYVGTGSRFEAEDKAGLSHFLEHMVFKGTPAYPTARQISEAIEGVGGVLDANTSHEVTVYWAKVAVQHFDRALRVLTEMLLQPTLPPAEVEKERRVILEELHMIADSPADWVFELLGQALWPGHALGRDIAGTPESVGQIGRQDLQSYREGWYTAGNIVAVVAGALPVAEVEAALAAAFADTLPGSTAPFDPAPPLPPEPRVVLGSRDIEQANLCLALPALSYKDPDRYVLLLLDTILGAGMSSRLFQSVREERALAYGIYSALRQHADTGALTIYAGVSPEKASECLAAVWTELERLAGEEVGEEELARAREYNKGRILLRMEDSYGVASWYGGQELLLDRIEEVDQVIAQIEAVRPADLHRLAQSLVRRDSIRLAAVGPFEDTTPLRQALGI
jgi:predicted Zn-dependent peptidase